MDLGGAGDPEGDPVGVVAGQRVAGVDRALGAEPDPAGGAVVEVDADRAHLAEAEHRFLVLAAGPQQPGAAEGQRREGRLQQHPALLPLVDVVALHHSVPAAHVLLVAGADPAGGVDVEVAANLAAAEPGPQQQLRRAEGASGDDRRHPGANGVLAAATQGSFWSHTDRKAPCVDANGPAALDQHTVDFDTGTDTRSGRDRPR